MNTLYLYEDDVSEKIAGWSAYGRHGSLRFL